MILLNYIKIAWRNLLRKKLFSFINIAGLALGLCFAGLIAIYIYEGWRVDRDRPASLYRVITDFTAEKKEEKLETVGRALIPAIEAEVPEVEWVIPVSNSHFNIRQGTNYFFDKIVFAGEHFLQGFAFPLLQGDAATALQQPNSVVLTETMALKYFGRSNVVGQTLVLSDTLNCQVTGVVKDPGSSHFNFDVLLSFSTWNAQNGPLNEWFYWDMTCYVTLKKNADPVLASQKISALSMLHNGEEYRSNGYDVRQQLEPARDIYLYSSLTGFNRATGSAKQLSVFALIGMALLLMACINFINLSTARQSERAKEVGVKKTMGASSGAVILQFLTETFVMVVIAGALALVLIFLLLPYVSTIAGQALSTQLLAEPPMMAAALALLVLTTLLAGWYPSFLLSKLKPIAIMRSQVQFGKSRFSLRQVLVVAQFTISLVFVIGTLVAADQLNYIKKKPLGFSKDNVIAIGLQQTSFVNVIQNLDVITQQLRMVPGVRSVSAAAALPGRSGWDGQLVLPEGVSKDKTLTMEVIPAAHEYVKTMGISMVAGRDFSRSFSTDPGQAVLLNEAACRLIGWSPAEAVGKKIQTAGLESGQIVGVMKDYHQHGLQQKIGPVLIFISPYAYKYIAVSAAPEKIDQTIAGLTAVWKSRFPGYPFNYFMLDDDLARQYQAESSLAKVVTLFSILTILVACMGLFGLTAFMVAQRTKEIGIRKVVGASVMHIVKLLARELVLLVVLALLIASPIAWWVMTDWLQEFAYRISIHPAVFILAGTGALLLAILTTSYLAMKAARANPVNSLKAE